MTNTYLRDRKLSDIGVMMAIDALIENGFVIIEPDKNEKLIGTEWEINLDRDYHVDISAYEVNDENKERWRNRRPRPTAIDVKYVTNSPSQTGQLFFEVDSKESNYGTRDGWGFYVYEEYAKPETHQRINDEQEGIRNIMFIQQNREQDDMIMQATNKENLIARYKSTRPNRQPFTIAPLHCMQWYYADNEDSRAINNHLSRLYRPENSNGLLMPLLKNRWQQHPYGERYPYIQGEWNATAQQWYIQQLGNGTMPRNKLASEGKLLEEDKAVKSLQQWHDEQREQWTQGTLDYDKLAPLSLQ